MALAPLAWKAGEDLAYEPAANRLHRHDCPQVAETSLRLIPRGGVLELMRAPELCARCRPEVTMALGQRASGT